MLTNQNPELIYGCKIAGTEISVKMFFLKNLKWSNIIAVVMTSRCHTELSAHDFYIYKKAFWAVWQEDVRGVRVKINSPFIILKLIDVKTPNFFGYCNKYIFLLCLIKFWGQKRLKLVRYMGVA